MSDLVDKFFSGDMSPEEEEALDSLLGSSVEDANRFADKAAEAYARFGLPDPGDDAGAGGKAWRRWMAGLALLSLAFLGGLAWRHYGLETSGSKAPRVSSPAGPAAGPAPERWEHRNPPPQRTKARKTIHSTRSRARRKDSPAPVSTSNPATSGSPAVSGRKPSTAPVPLERRKETPKIPPAKGAAPPPAVSGGKSYSRLKVKVEVSQEGPVTVRVLDARGVPVKTIYSGNLPAGTYAFTWDGRLDDGRKASPGAYRVETRSGATVQTMEFLIESKGKK